MDRLKAPYLYQSLQYALNLIQAGEQNPELVIREIKKFLSEKTISKIDYVDIRDAFSLEKVTTLQNAVVIALAVFFGDTRFIDNVVFSPDEIRK